MVKFDSNTLRVDAKNFQIRNKIFADTKISGYVWAGPQF